MFLHVFCLYSTKRARKHTMRSIFIEIQGTMQNGTHLTPNTLQKWNTLYKRLKCLENLDYFSTCFKTFTVAKNYYQKRWFCTVFTSWAQNVPKHMQNAVFSPNINVLQIWQQNTLQNIKHTAKWGIKKKLHERFQSIYKNQNLLPKSINMSIRMQTAVISQQKTMFKMLRPIGQFSEKHRTQSKIMKKS